MYLYILINDYTERHSTHVILDTYNRDLHCKKTQVRAHLTQGCLEAQCYFTSTVVEYTLSQFPNLIFMTKFAKSELVNKQRFGMSKNHMTGDVIDHIP